MTARTHAFWPWLISGTVACSGEPSAHQQGTIGRIEQAFTPVQPRSIRPNIHSYNFIDQLALRNAILDFITQPVLDEHANAVDWHHPAAGELFFSRHHAYLNQLESYLLANGSSAFVPVPEWDPGTPIPGAFMLTDPLVSSAVLNQNPNQPIPAAFANDQLCKFANASLLAQSVENWHDGVHVAVGGAMSRIPEAPGAPIFWLWHGLLDDMYHERTWRCETLPALDSL